MEKEIETKKEFKVGDHVQSIYGRGYISRVESKDICTVRLTGFKSKSWIKLQMHVSNFKLVP